MSVKRTKVVKVWVVLFDGHFQEILESTNGLAVFRSNYDARRIANSELLKVVPCTLTYELPHTKKIKKVKK